MSTRPLPFDIIFLISRHSNLSVLSKLCLLNRTLNQTLTPHLYTLGAEACITRNDATTNPGIWALLNNPSVFMKFVKYGLQGNKTVTFHPPSPSSVNKPNEPIFFSQEITFTYLHLMTYTTSYIPGTNRSFMTLLGPPLGAQGINVEDSFGQTPLHWAAAKSDNWMWIVMLIQKGARTEVRNRWGRTPMHIAASEGNLEGIRMLHEMGAEVNAVDDDGVTPLGRARIMGRTSAEELLKRLYAVLEVV